MIRLFKVKEKQKELGENVDHGPPVKRQSAGELRLHKDISELNLPKSCAISFPNGKDDLMNFEVFIRPDEGYYVGGKFLFSFQVSSVYPHEAPKVKCKTKVYHPNIDLEGNVCLNILREDWKPVLNINTVIYGLYHLFTEPNYEDPLNHEAAAVLRDNPKMFESNVKRAMAGGYVGQTYFSRWVLLLKHCEWKNGNMTRILSTNSVMRLMDLTFQFEFNALTSCNLVGRLIFQPTCSVINQRVV